MWSSAVDLASVALMALWPALELYLVATRRARGGRVEGGGAAIVWMVVAPASMLALGTRALGLAPFPLAQTWSLPAAAALVACGLALRLTALRSLGAHFSVDVASGPRHRLVTRGIYSHLRHPAYTGLLLGFLGLGVFSWSWVGLAVATIPTVAVLVGRIRVEERLLRERFGATYERYSAGTSRLIPWVY